MKDQSGSTKTTALEEVWCKACAWDGACFWDECPLKDKTLAEKEKGCPLKTRPRP